MATAVAMLLLPVCMMAQTNFSKAVEKFVSGKQTRGYVESSKVEGDGNRLPFIFSREYRISVPKADKKHFDKLYDALKKDERKAVRVKESVPGKGREFEEVCYGAELKQRKAIGWDSKYNYLVVYNSDKKHTLYRYVGVMEWKEDGDKIVCEIMVLRTDDPDKMNSERKTVTHETSSTKFWTEFSKLQTAFNGDLTSPTSSFSEKMNSCGYAATSIMKLCREYSKVLSSDDKQVCREILTDMKRKTQDKYINGMLMLAMKAMM